MLVFEAIAWQIWRGIFTCKLQTMIPTMIQTKRLGRFAAAWACEGGSISFYVLCHFLCSRVLQLTMWTSDLITVLYIVCWICRSMQNNKTKKRKFKTKKHWKPTVGENGTPVLYHNILNQALEKSLQLFRVLRA